MGTKNNIFATLIHYPVYNKKKEIVATSVTTLDVHDIARISRTYGLAQFYIVTPIDSHRELIRRILKHWMKGHGATYNPNRKEAFENLTVVETFENAIECIKNETGKIPKVIVTAARKFPGSINYVKMKELISTGEPYMILFGTGWGLADEIVSKADYILNPIDGGTDYNHLPVRGAFAITIDRLLGQ